MHAITPAAASRFAAKLRHALFAPRTRASLYAVTAVVATGSLFGAPALTRQPLNVAVTAGQNATFTVAGTGAGPLTYQWRRTGFLIAGATSNTFVLGGVTGGDAGLYDVVVSDGTGSTTSAAATLSVAPTTYPKLVAPDAAKSVPLESDNGVMVTVLAPLPDGGYIAAGAFATVNGQPRSMILRVNADQTLNTSFVPPDFVGIKIQAVAIQPDGKILVGGMFSRVGYTARNSLVRLNADGSLDVSFNPPTSTMAYVSGIVVQPDGKIVVAAWPSPLLVQLNPDGSIDKTLAPGVGGTINAIARQADGGILAVGIPITTGGGSVIRVSPDGTWDRTFQSPSFPGSLQSVCVASDGRIYVGGTLAYGASGSPLMRLTSSGAMDTTFATSLRGTVNAIAEQNDGAIVVAGYFTAPAGAASSNLIRFTPNGGLDSTFVPQYPDSPWALLAQSDGTIVVGLNTNSSSFRQAVARFSATGNLLASPSFTAHGRGMATALVRIPGGKFLVFGQFDYAGSIRTKNVLRLNSDGSVDSSFASTAVGNGDYPNVASAAALPDGRVALAGTFTSPIPTPVRLANADGSKSSAFTPVVGPVASGSDVAILSNGNMLVGGAATATSSLSRPGAVAVYKLDGSLDASFANGAPFDQAVSSVSPLADGHILVGGYFTKYNGTTTGALVRLNADGSLDPTFNAGPTLTSAYHVIPAPSGQIYVVGSWNAATTSVVRLNPDGTRDATFQPALSVVAGALLQANGQLIVWQEDPSTIGGTGPTPERLNPDGSVDRTFVTSGIFPYNQPTGANALMRDDGQLLYMDGQGGTNRVVNTIAAAPPTFSTVPASAITAAGGPAKLLVGVTSLVPVTYQWSLNGTAIPGATNATYSIASFQAANVGKYTVTVTSDFGTIVSPAVSISVPPDLRGHIINLSIRAIAGTGDNRLIVGVVLGGAGTGGNKQLLYRGVGPTLTKFGVTGVLADPTIEIYDNTGFMIDQNDDWNGVFDFQSVGAFPFDGPSPKDAAIYNPYATNGVQTMHVVGKNGASGVALAEIYDATPAGEFTELTPRFVNGSARTNVGVGDNVLILGFVVSGHSSERMLIRAVGPSLAAAPFNVGGVLADPTLEIYNTQTNVKIAENDNWGDNGAAPGMLTAFSAVGAFGFSSTSSKDSALVVTLPPGTYSAVVRGVADTTGVALVELYAMP